MIAFPEKPREIKFIFNSTEIRNRPHTFSRGQKKMRRMLKTAMNEKLLRRFPRNDFEQTAEMSQSKLSFFCLHGEIPGPLRIPADHFRQVQEIFSVKGGDLEIHCPGF